MGVGVSGPRGGTEFIHLHSSLLISHTNLLQRVEKILWLRLPLPDMLRTHPMYFLDILSCQVVMASMCFSAKLRMLSVVHLRVTSHQLCLMPDMGPSRRATPPDSALFAGLLDDKPDSSRL